MHCCKFNYPKVNRVVQIVRSLTLNFHDNAIQTDHLTALWVELFILCIHLVSADTLHSVAMVVNHRCELKGHQIKWNCWGKKQTAPRNDSRHCNPCSHLIFNKLNNCTLFLFKKILFGVQIKEVRDVQKSMWKRLWWMCIFLTRTDTIELTREFDLSMHALL